MWGKLSIVALVAGTLGVASTALAGLTPLLVGNNIPIDTGKVTNVGGLSIAYNSVDNEFRIAWYDSRIVGQNDVYAQRVGADGKLVGDNVEIIVGPDSSTETSISHDPIKNQYLITWKNQSGSPGSPGFNHTYGGIASADGGLVSGFRDLSNGGLEPTLVFNATKGEFFLEARNFAGGGTAGIRGQRISTEGMPVGGGITIATAGAPAPAGQVAYNSSADQYLATWRDQTAEDLKGRILNADGSYVTNPFQISSIFPESGLAASVAFDPVNDRYLVIFSRFSQGDILAQFVDPGGNLLGPVLTIVESMDRLSPFVVRNPLNGLYLLAWQESSVGALQVLLLDADAAVLGTPLTVNDANTSMPRITANPADGSFLLAWVDYTNSPTEADVLAQLVAVTSDVVGDVNCDGRVDFGDINPFVLALTDPGGYASAFPYCDRMNADINGDNVVDFGDINPFVDLLTSP